MWILAFPSARIGHWTLTAKTCRVGSCNPFWSICSPRRYENGCHQLFQLPWWKQTGELSGGAWGQGPASCPANLAKLPKCAVTAPTSRQKRSNKASHTVESCLSPDHREQQSSVLHINTPYIYMEYWAQARIGSTGWQSVPHHINCVTTKNGVVCPLPQIPLMKS